MRVCEGYMSERDNEFCEVESREYYEKALNKNVEYYTEAFKRLDETEKNTWNWAAFFFGSSWLFYRKMYLCGFIIFMIERFIVRFMSDNNMIFPLFVFLGLRLLWGYFGNAWYYDVVKARIGKGYHLLDKYSPTSFTSGISSFLGFLVCWADQISLKKQLKTETEYKVNEETIRAYLNSARENPGIVKAANIIIWLFLFVGLLCYLEL